MSMKITVAVVMMRIMMVLRVMVRMVSVPIFVDSCLRMDIGIFGIVARLVRISMANGTTYDIHGAATDEIGIRNDHNC